MTLWGFEQGYFTVIVRRRILSPSWKRMTFRAWSGSQNDIVRRKRTAFTHSVLSTTRLVYLEDFWRSTIVIVQMRNCIL